MGDIDDDGVLDLIVGAGKGHAPEVVAYSGKAAGGTRAFETELARFMAFASEARGGISVAASQVDGTSADNIIVGSGPGIADEVRVYGSQLSAPGTAPALFSKFSPYPDDRSGVTVSAGFVDLMSGRNSIVTAPGPGSPAEVKVFTFSLMTPIGSKPDPSGAGQPATAAAFKPFGDAYRDGVSLATGWLAGSVGGAERIVVGQLAGTGTVKVYSGGSALQGGPSLYLHSAMGHSHPDYTEVASFNPFGEASGVSVATTSTTSGADLLVSGISPKDKTVQVLKYELVRPKTDAVTLEAVQLGQVVSAAGSLPNVLGGD
jgi:hypothetical protein